MRYTTEWRGKEFDQEWVIIDMHSDTTIISGVHQSTAKLITLILNDKYEGRQDAERH